MTPEAELAEFVMDHLSRQANQLTIAIGALCTGVASFAQAYHDAQECRGNWGEMLSRLREGFANVRPAIPVIRERGGAGAAALVSFGERQLDFALLMEAEIIRLQAHESTGA